MAQEILLELLNQSHWTGGEFAFRAVSLKGPLKSQPCWHSAVFRKGQLTGLLQKYWNVTATYSCTKTNLIVWLLFGSININVNDDHSAWDMKMKVEAICQHFKYAPLQVFRED